VLCSLRPAAPPDVARRISLAQARFADGEYAEVARVTGPLARDPGLPRADRGEAWRLYGLALALLGLRAEAEAALYEYLKLEPEAHLDPALVPPEALLLFEEVRTRHAGELRVLKPRARRKRSLALSLVPVAGQFQNGEATKGWVLAAVEGSLLAANVTTYVLLSRACGSDKTCDVGVASARALRTANLATGALLGATVIYGVIDAYRGHRRLERQEARRVMAMPVSSGATVVFRASF
jgi:hypothetical protein